MSVVLPAPLGPRYPNAAPRRIRRSTESTAMPVAEALAQCICLDDIRVRRHVESP